MSPRGAVFSVAAQREAHSTAEFDADAGVESDDSDVIIISPSRPLRNREVLML